MTAKEIVKDWLFYPVSKLEHNTLWCPMDLHLVSGAPDNIDYPPIYATETCGEIRIYFRRKRFAVDVDAIKGALGGLLCGRIISGYDVNRLLSGEICIYFNPLYHKACDRMRAIERITEELNKGIVCALEVELEEDS